MKDKAKQKEKQSNPAPEEKTSQAAPSKASKKTAPMEEEDKDEKKEGKKETKKSEHQLVPVSKVENSRGNKRAANAALEPENAPDGSERPAKRTAAALWKLQRTSEKNGRWKSRSGQTKFLSPHCDICPQHHMSKKWQPCFIHRSSLLVWLRFAEVQSLFSNPKSLHRSAGSFGET